MASTTGTATDLVDLITDLKDWLVTTGSGNPAWTLEEFTTKTGSTELYIKAPGLSVSSGDEVYVVIRSMQDTSSSQYWLETRGAIGYDGSISTDLRFVNQPGTSATVYTRLRNTSMSYWFFANDRRLIVIIKAGIAYRTIYAGLINPYADPEQYPYPYYVASDAGYSGAEGESNASIRAFVDPGDGGAYLRTSNGSWVKVANHKDADGETDEYIDGALSFDNADPDNYQITYSPDSAAGDVTTFTLPWHNGLFTVTGTPDDGYRHLVYPALRNSPSDTWSLTQVELLSYNNGGNLGAIEGAYHISGFGGITAEQVITISSQDYLIFPNISRTGYQHWFAVEDS